MTDKEGCPMAPHITLWIVAQQQYRPAHANESPGEPQPQPDNVARVPEAFETVLDPKAEREPDGLNIEDSAIRELAGSLQPQGR
ncbi:hypothetical protein [Microvirga yunnanensis]|uniref:hypothetical protein n=1 Tax=Microvirga yunnanensis TaxID=2953740 RepID=UPI0021C89F6E|nr:hypothetical protein [Microvirga sp. HBU65207]